MPTPAKPIPSPRCLALAAMSWKCRSSARRMPRPSSMTVSAAAAGSARTAMMLAPESSELATISVRIVSSRSPG